MAKTRVPSEFIIRIDHKECTLCDACVISCGWDALSRGTNKIIPHHDKCVDCQRCVYVCPTNCITIEQREVAYKDNANWTPDHLKDIWRKSEGRGGQIKVEELPYVISHRREWRELERREEEFVSHQHFGEPGWQEDHVRAIHKQAEQGGMLLTAMGSPLPYPVIWDHLLLDACQVTNPPIDPLREPMELHTVIGRSPDRVEVGQDGSLRSEPHPTVVLETPIVFAAMSFGSISLNAQKSLAMAAQETGILWNTGEGGMAEELLPYADRAIVQCASGRFGVSQSYLRNSAAIEIKIGQGAKPGIGGHLPSEKVVEEISRTRMIPQGTDALSPAPHHDIYSIEDPRQLIFALKEASDYQKPVGVKIAAVHNVAAIASGIVRAGADFVYIDGIRGGSGATPAIMRDHVGIPIEVALAAVDERLRQESIRHQASLIVGGSIRGAADIAKAIALGADAVGIATAALIVMGCDVCQKCYTGNCSWGITTHRPELTKVLNPNVMSKRLANLISAWSLELKEVLGAMGVNAIESLRGNRDRLRGIGLDPSTLEVLGVKPAGR
ncbi:MAG: glutamate synthase-related protein [Chloroflexota bacterium]|nr:glutamate synthase-related protein [Chloroflexota bacterium]